MTSLSAFFHEADEISLRGQRRHLRMVRVQLGLLIAAGSFSVWFDESGEGAFMALGAVSLVLAGLSEVLMWRGQADRLWYRGRAAAESAKTLAWRYAVAGRPFDIGLDPSTADVLLIGRLGEIADALDLDGLEVRTVDDEVTDWMRNTRSASIERRRSVYVAERLSNQADWYSAKADVNATLRLRWSAFFALAVTLGVAVSIVYALGPADISLLGVFASIGLAVMGWRATKSHGDLAEAYAVTAGELATSIATADRVPDEENAWASFVDSAEHAISREHTMWTATRSDQ